MEDIYGQYSNVVAVVEINKYYKCDGVVDKSFFHKATEQKIGMLFKTYMVFGTNNKIIVSS